MNTLSKDVIRWFKKNARNLPWRGVGDSYKVWISEVMLQQTTVKAVIPYYKAWIRRFPTVKHVARSRLQSVLKAWQGLGYYRRAENIYKSSKIIVKQYKGRLPDDFQSLRKLPGFGDYTAGAVLSMAFNKKAVIIDANIKRVFIRQLAIQHGTEKECEKRIKSHLLNILPEREISAFNQGIMEIGALICRRVNPICNQCPIRISCEAYKKGIQEIIPQPKSVSIRQIDCAIAVLRKNGRIFIQKRPQNGLFANLWEFPGGKLKRGETAQRALKREVFEELGVNLVKHSHLLNLTQFYTQFKARLHVFECLLDKYPVAQSNCKWLTLNEIKNYPMPSGSSKILDYLIKSKFT